MVKSSNHRRKKKSREKKVAKQLQKSQKAVNKMAILSPYLPKLTKFSRILQNFFQETIKKFQISTNFKLQKLS